MSTRFERVSALTGILTVCLWIVGVVLAQGMTHQPADNATDAQVLTWVKDHSGLITAGSWIYMIGCGCFFWFAGTLRNRLAAAEGGTAPAALNAANEVAVEAFLGRRLPFPAIAEVIERVGDERLQLYLYHIPPVSQVPITLALIEKLLSES